MCGCSSNTIPYKSANRNEKHLQSCDYTLEQLQSWHQRLLCVKNNNLYTDLVTINSYLGVVESAINSPSYICYFKMNLDIIYLYILNLIENNICNE